MLVRYAFFITLCAFFKMEFWSVCPSRLLFWGEGYTFLFLCWLMECGCYCFSPQTRSATLLLASFSRCKDTARMLYHTNTNVAFTYKFVTFVTFLRIHTYKKRFVCLIGGRVCNPRQQQYVMYVLALSDYKQLAAAAGYKPAPQLGR